LSRNPETQFDGVICVNRFEDVLHAAQDAEEIMIIGGSTIYKMLLPQANRLYLTYVDAEFEGDAWFPPFDENQWLETDVVSRQADEKNAYDCRFVTLEKK
jgi:dihydrofolate reductase